MKKARAGIENRLCDQYSGKGALRCYPDKSGKGCPGAEANNCYPNIVWSKDTSSSNYVYYNLSGGTFNGPYNNPATYAFGVRCVLGFENTEMTTDELCDSASGKGALRCYPDNSGNGCPGANGNNCQPHVVWSKDYQTAGTNYYIGNLNSGTFNASTSNYANYTNAYGVRCVLGFESTELMQTTAL